MCVAQDVLGKMRQPAGDVQARDFVAFEQVADEAPFERRWGEQRAVEVEEGGDVLWGRGHRTASTATRTRGLLFGSGEVAAAFPNYGHGLPARVEKLGPEPLEVTLAEFAGRLKRRKARIKSVLLDQHFVRGVGNIYADEALFRAGIHPLAIGARLRPERVKRLHAAIVEVLTQAIAKGGSSISDYVDADGRRGFFQFEHRVYQRTGEPCVVCGAAIRRTLVAQRGTHYCPRCQR